MANVYIKMIQDAKDLPAAYLAMGTRSETWRDRRSGTPVTGWNICQFLYKMNEDGDSWWSNDFNLVVDDHGSLWELHLNEEWDESSDTRTSNVNLKRVDGEQLRIWHVNNWDFAKMQRSIAALI